MALQRMSDHLVGRNDVVYYGSLQPRQAINKQVLIILNEGLKKKCVKYAKRHNKVVCQHDNDRPHKTK